MVELHFCAAKAPKKKPPVPEPPDVGDLLKELTPTTAEMAELHHLTRKRMLRDQAALALLGNADFTKDYKDHKPMIRAAWAAAGLFAEEGGNYSDR